jgi:uncharacterized protein (TIGR00730 family)
MVQYTPSRANLIAFEDPEFLHGDSMRGARFLLEYQKAEEHLRAWGVRSTIVVFGSARVPSPEEAESIRAAGGLDPETLATRLRWYEESRRFGRIVSEHGGALDPFDHGLRDNVICTGGGPGIMEAANRGAHDAGAPSVGLNITLPHEQYPNPYSTPDLTFTFHYFHIRKFHLAKRANGLAIFPGGFGTLDECFEILNLRITNKASPLPIVLIDRDYWSQIVDFDALVRHGMVSADELDNFEIVDTADEAWEAMLRRGLKKRVPPLANGRKSPT